MGEKQPPFFFEFVKYFEKVENITHYSSTNEYIIQIINKNQLQHSLNKEKIQNFTKPIEIISPILNTNFFYILDEEKNIYIVNSYGLIIKIPDTICFNLTSFNFSLLNEKIYLFINSLENHLKIFEITSYHQSIKKK